LAKFLNIKPPVFADDSDGDSRKERRELRIATRLLTWTLEGGIALEVGRLAVANLKH
jgi:hypothetical protein